MTIVVTRNVAPRVRGFLASVMLEIAPGVYISPRLNQGVRERLLGVLDDYWMGQSDQGIVVCWESKQVPCGIDLKIWGSPVHSIEDIDGLFLCRRALTDNQLDRMRKLIFEK
ncbi:type I-E CRISPR-associated endoribonuclease Cas2 [bacterium]|nr:type I-E CRISPR-associated endoribonuclease Cas2 [candidate division CSSED10-310 bacterium]